jgi:DNA invertase Pin-like site-specific DNA recombinase
MTDTATRTGQRIVYIRVSTEDQDTARQQDMSKTADRVFEEQRSGKSVEGRPALQEALAYVRAGDTLVVWSLDRLTRSLSDLDRIVKDLTSRGVTLELLSEGMTFPGGEEIDPSSEAMLYLLGIFAQFERRIKSAASREGIAIAKEEGRFRGRKPVPTNADVQKLRDRADTGMPKAKLAREFDISRDTVYRALSGDYMTAERWIEATAQIKRDKRAQGARRREKNNA